MADHYTVRLSDGELPAPARIQAELRYVTTLERVLGGPATVAAVYQAWRDASEAAAEELDAETARLAVRWPAAARQAEQAGLRELGELPSAHFDMRLERRSDHT